jgi:hypothetical protein
MLHALCLLKFGIRDPQLPNCPLPAYPDFVAGLPAESIFPLLPSSFSAINASFEEDNYGSDHN